MKTSTILALCMSSSQLLFGSSSIVGKKRKAAEELCCLPRLNKRTRTEALFALHVPGAIMSITPSQTKQLEMLQAQLDEREGEEAAALYARQGRRETGRLLRFLEKNTVPDDIGNRHLVSLITTAGYFCLRKEKMDLLLNELLQRVRLKKIPKEALQELDDATTAQLNLQNRYQLGEVALIPGRACFSADGTQSVSIEQRHMFGHQQTFLRFTPPDAADDHELVFRTGSRGLTCSEFSPDNTHLLFGFQGDYLMTYHLPTRTWKYFTTRQRGVIKKAQWATDSKKLIAEVADLGAWRATSIVVVDTETREQRARHFAAPITVLDRNSTHFLIKSGPGSCAIHDMNTLDETENINVRARLAEDTIGKFSPDERALFLYTGGITRIYRHYTDERYHLALVHTNTFPPQWHPTASLAAFFATSEAPHEEQLTLKLWQPAFVKDCCQLPTDTASLRWNNKGDCIALFGGGIPVQLYDVKSKSVTLTSVFRTPYTGIWSTDDTVFTAACHNKTRQQLSIYHIDRKKGDLLAEQRCHVRGAGFKRLPKNEFADNRGTLKQLYRSPQLHTTAKREEDNALIFSDRVLVFLPPRELLSFKQTVMELASP